MDLVERRVRSAEEALSRRGGQDEPGATRGVAELVNDSSVEAALYTLGTVAVHLACRGAMPRVGEVANRLLRLLDRQLVEGKHRGREVAKFANRLLQKLA